MIETFLLSFHLKLTYRKNSIIYAFQQFPLIGKYFSNHLYGNGGIEALIGVISAFIEFISIFHVAVDASIKFVAVNNAKNPCKIRLYEGFYNSTF